MIWDRGRHRISIRLFWCHICRNAQSVLKKTKCILPNLSYILGPKRSCFRKITSQMQVPHQRENGWMMIVSFWRICKMMSIREGMRGKPIEPACEQNSQSVARRLLKRGGVCPSAPWQTCMYIHIAPAFKIFLVRIIIKWIWNIVPDWVLVYIVLKIDLLYLFCHMMSCPEVMAKCCPATGVI